MDYNTGKYKFKTQPGWFRILPKLTSGMVGHAEVRYESEYSSDRYIILTDTHFGIHNNSKTVMIDSIIALKSIIIETINDELTAWYLRNILGTKKYHDVLLSTEHIQDEKERRKAVLKIMDDAYDDTINVPTLSFHLVHCGDLFDSRSSINVELAAAVFNLFAILSGEYYQPGKKRYQYLIESFTFIGGNHDYANNYNPNASSMDLIISRCNEFAYKIDSKEGNPVRSYKLDPWKFTRFNIVTKEAYCTNHLYLKHNLDYQWKINEESKDIVDACDDFEGDTTLMDYRQRYKIKVCEDMREQCLLQHIFIPWLGTEENKTSVDEFLSDSEIQEVTNKIMNRYEEHLSKCMEMLHRQWSHYYKEERETFYNKQKKDIQRIEKALNHTIPQKTKLRHAIIIFCHLDIFGKYDVNHNHIEPLLKSIQKYPELWTGKFEKDEEYGIERELEIMVVSGHIHGPRQLFTKQGIPKHIKFLNLGSSLYHTFNDTDDKFLHILGLDPESPRDGPVISIKPIPMNDCIRYHNLYGLEGLDQLECGKRKDGKTNIKTKDFIRWYLTAEQMSSHLDTIKKLRTRYSKLEILPYTENLSDNGIPAGEDSDTFTFDINHLSEYLPEHLRDLYNQYAL